MKVILGFILFIIPFLLALAIGAQNHEVINFNYLIAQGEFQLSTLLGIFFGGGFIVGWLFCGVLYLKSRIDLGLARKENMKHKSAIKKLSKNTIKE